MRHNCHSKTCSVSLMEDEYNITMMNLQRQGRASGGRDSMVPSGWALDVGKHVWRGTLWHRPAIPDAQEPEAGRVQTQGLPGIQSEFTAGLDNSAGSCLKVKRAKGSADIDQWQSVCLACVRPWLPLPELQKQEAKSTIKYRPSSQNRPTLGVSHHLLPVVSAERSF